MSVSKRDSQAQLRKGVHASHMKQMVLDFFDANRLIYTKMVKKGQYVNATFNMDTLTAFLTIFKQKRLQMVEQGWILIGTSRQFTPPP